MRPILIFEQLQIHVHQVDTMDIRPESGYVSKHFAAGDVITKWGFSDVRSAATSLLARELLEKLISARPFRVAGVHVDGGSEFYGDFERACKELGIRLFTVLPRSPKLNDRGYEIAAFQTIRKAILLLLRYATENNVSVSSGEGLARFWSNVTEKTAKLAKLSVCMIDVKPAPAD